MDLLTHAARLRNFITIAKPAAPGPAPVVIQMHGCGGVQPMQFRYAKTAQDLGVAAVIVDSLGPRGIGRREAQLTICSGLRLRGAERALDLFAVLRWLQDQSWADAERIAVAGWSHGAWAIMEALTETAVGSAGMSQTLSRLKAAVLFYPYAGALSRTRRHGWAGHRPKVYACLAGRDAVVGRVQPARALRRLSEDGLEVRVVTLDRATHCFDDPHASDPRTIYRADLADEAQSFYKIALVEALR